MESDVVDPVSSANDVLALNSEAVGVESSLHGYPVCYIDVVISDVVLRRTDSDDHCDEESCDEVAVEGSQCEISDVVESLCESDADVAHDVYV